MENATQTTGGGLIASLNDIQPGTQFFIVMILMICFVVFTHQKDVTDMGLLLGTSYAAYMTGRAQQIVNSNK